jgi:hypothetical protein
MKETLKKWADYLYVAEVLTIFSTLVISLISYAVSMREF